MGGPTSGAGNLGRLDGLEREERLARLQMHGGLTTTDVDELAGDVPLGFDAADQMIENAIGVLGLPLGLGAARPGQRAGPRGPDGGRGAVGHRGGEPRGAARARRRRLRRRRGSRHHDRPDPRPRRAGPRGRRGARAGCRADAPRRRRRGPSEHGAARRRGAWARGARPAGRVVRAGAGGPRPRRCRRRHGRECDQHAGRGARAGGRGHRRRCERACGSSRTWPTAGCARVRCRIPVELLRHGDLDGAEVAHRIAEACAIAAADPYRAATHNKGIMNGIDAVALATGQDWRGIEAGAHAYAARTGRYEPLSRWTVGRRCAARRARAAARRGDRGRQPGPEPAGRRRAAPPRRVVGARELAQVMARSAWRRTWRRSARSSPTASSAATWRCTPAASWRRSARRRRCGSR